MKIALITGGAYRIGMQICHTLHRDGYFVIIHYRNSFQAANNLMNKLNNIRQNSASILQAELSNIQEVNKLCNAIKSLEILVNNASIFYSTPVDKLNQHDYQSIMNTNLMAPLFLSSTLSDKLAHNQGCIINIIDIHSERPLKNYTIYSISKAAVAMMTKTLAKELAPNVRVCGVSPGSILWPTNVAKLNQVQKNKILKKIVLRKQGSAQDIADTVLFLAKSTYITGQIINVDGGRTLNQ
ncbi:pteridine reductase [Candidatus Vesicomyidisocius calyptogenae]|uniref:Oxidoreductase n=1 Tax=Vesicomyosocius okutanii subsp. Calyptogena okutanii (strain HA) TaxID=412965 RepID=A5CWY5_VESOH|nr:pteridine reductase [Candidatus Vesicomyosocius okutanii]BAF61526.1 oxidoreductase [Candidatus Vesicomyosocius okutanii]